MYGIALEGGGARGAYQVGVWKALKELGIEYRGVVGTSVGALNGAMMVQGDFEKAFAIWSEMEPCKVINFDMNLYESLNNKEMFLDNAFKLLQHIKSLFKEKGMDITPLRQMLHEYINEDLIRKAEIEFGMITVSLTDLNPMKLFLTDIPDGKLIDYLIASARLPVFQKQIIDGKVFLDGGFYDNFPINLLISKGYKDIIAVRLIRSGMKRWDKITTSNITLISPSERLGSMLDFSNAKARNNIQMGYYDALRVLKGYQGKKYCVCIKKEEDYFFELFLRIDNNKLEKLLEKLGTFNDIPRKRTIFERLVPITIQLMELDNNVSYQDIVIALLERIANQLKIDRYKIYDYDELLDKIIKNYKFNTENNRIKLPKILQGHDLALLPYKEQILDEITDILLFTIKNA